MTSPVPKGWWKDYGMTAHFYEDVSGGVAWPLCTPEPIPDGQHDSWMDMVIEIPSEEARPFTDMGTALLPPCAGCEKAASKGDAP